MSRTLSFVCLAVFTALVLFSPEALANDGFALTSKGESLLNFLSTRVGPLIIGLGVIGGAGALVMGIPGALQKLIATVVGGILITSVPAVIGLVTSL